MPTIPHPARTGTGFYVASKRYTLTPGVEILFSRSMTVEVKAPSGRTVQIEDSAPDILIVSVGSATAYYERTGGGWREMDADAATAALDEIDAAEVSKRAPKF